MSDLPSIKLQVRSDRPTATASQAYNSKVDALAFNISFIAKYQPKLAVELLQLYAKAHAVTEMIRKHLTKITRFLPKQS